MSSAADVRQTMFKVKLDTCNIALEKTALRIFYKPKIIMNNANIDVFVKTESTKN